MIKKFYLTKFEACVKISDSINDSNPRVIKDVRPRKLALDLRCSYYETCAIYGLNVERVFQDGNLFRYFELDNSILIPVLRILDE